MRTNDASETPQDAAGEASARNTEWRFADSQSLPCWRLLKALDMLRSLLVAHIGKRSKRVLAFILRIVEMLHSFPALPAHLRIR